jgi:hypothetical protein
MGLRVAERYCVTTDKGRIYVVLAPSRELAVNRLHKKYPALVIASVIAIEELIE